VIAIGQQIDVWIVDEVLGKGGMGSVCRCHNVHAPRILAALKILDPAFRHDEDIRARFVREAEILATLDHPHIVKVRNVRLEMDPPHLEMEYVKGASLSHLLRTGPLQVGRTLDLLEQLASAVAYLHRKQVRHRDIKPANILLRADGMVKLVDFGLAVESGAEPLTAIGAMFGTVSYAPPEWIEPTTLDPESWDIYAMGTVAWECLTGQAAFPATRGMDQRQQAVSIMAEKQKLDHLDPGARFEPALRSLVREMTTRDPAARIKTARKVLHRISRVPRPSSGSSATPPGPGDPDWMAFLLADTTSGDQGPVLRRLQGEDQSPPAWQLAEEAKSVPAPAAVRDAPTIPRPTPPGAPTRRRRGPALLLGSSVVLALCLVGFFLLQTLTRATERDVEVVVTGLPPGTPLAVRLDSRLPTRTEGHLSRFQGTRIGALSADWVVGPDCATVTCPPSDCEPWCVVGSSSLTVPPGDDLATLQLPLSPPPRPTVVLTAPAVDEPVRFQLDDEVVVASGEARFADIEPGRHLARVEIGDCPDEALGCASAGSCPPGCSSLQTVVTVAARTEDQQVEVPVPLPAPTEDPPAEARDEPGPAPPVRPAVPVSAGRFADWLVAHPEWQRDAAIAAGRADDNYLRTWQDGEVPGPREAAVVDVSWWAAWTYCQDRGGLAGLDAPPLKWTEGQRQPFQEWRADGSDPAWRRSDGAESHAVRRTESNSFTGFRCAR